jgi:hypothetical protein
MKNYLYLLMTVGSVFLYSCGGGSGDPTPATPAPVKQKETINLWLKMVKNESIQVADLKLYKKSFEAGITLQSDTTQVSVFDFSITPVSGNKQLFLFRDFKSNYAFKFEVLTKDSLTPISGQTNYLLLKSGYKESNTPLVVKLI